MNSAITALEKAVYVGAWGIGARAKKYSVDSWKPEKFPTGDMRPVALALKRPAGIDAEPFCRKARFSGYTVLL